MVRVHVTTSDENIARKVGKKFGIGFNSQIAKRGRKGDEESVFEFVVVTTEEELGKVKIPTEEIPFPGTGGLFEPLTIRVGIHINDLFMSEKDEQFIKKVKDHLYGYRNTLDQLGNIYPYAENNFVGAAISFNDSENYLCGMLPQEITFM